MLQGGSSRCFVATSTSRTLPSLLQGVAKSRDPATKDYVMQQCMLRIRDPKGGSRATEAGSWSTALALCSLAPSFFVLTHCRSHFVFHADSLAFYTGVLGMTLLCKLVRRKFAHYRMAPCHSCGKRLAGAHPAHLLSSAPAQPAAEPHPFCAGLC